MQTGPEMLDIARCRTFAILCFELREEGVIQKTERDAGVIREV